MCKNTLPLRPYVKRSKAGKCVCVSAHSFVCAWGYRLMCLYSHEQEASVWFPPPPLLPLSPPLSVSHLPSSLRDNCPSMSEQDMGAELTSTSWQPHPLGPGCGQASAVLSQ